MNVNALQLSTEIILPIVFFLTVRHFAIIALSRVALERQLIQEQKRCGEKRQTIQIELKAKQRVAFRKPIYEMIFLTICSRCMMLHLSQVKSLQSQRPLRMEHMSVQAEAFLFKSSLLCGKTIKQIWMRRHVNMLEKITRRQMGQTELTMTLQF